MDQPAIAPTTHVVDAIVMTAIERVGNPQNCRQREHRLLIGSVQGSIIKVAFFGRGPAMIARGVRNHVALGLRKAGQFRVLDEIESVFMVRLVRNVITNVMQ